MDLTSHIVPPKVAETWTQDNWKKYFDVAQALHGKSGEIPEEIWRLAYRTVTGKLTIADIKGTISKRVRVWPKKACIAFLASNKVMSAYEAQGYVIHNLRDFVIEAFATAKVYPVPKAPKIYERDTVEIKPPQSKGYRPIIPEDYKVLPIPCSNETQRNTLYSEILKNYQLEYGDKLIVARWELDGKRFLQFNNAKTTYVFAVG